MDIISAAVRMPANDTAVVIACCAAVTKFWVEISHDLFADLRRLSLAGGEVDDPHWLETIRTLEAALINRPLLAFPHFSYLINLGTSWWLPNYFLNIRLAKQHFGIRYVPFVHDCIPILRPEVCVPALTRQFIGWAMGIFEHADHVLSNSQWTANSVEQSANLLGRNCERPKVIRLDADYRSSIEEALGGESYDVIGWLERHELKGRNFVLFVGTIEPRKNHELAFAAWLSLIRKFGSEKVPPLICVGNKGWLHESIYMALGRSELLQSRVEIFAKLSDVELDALYKSCLFTVYPSALEGWGLPVTESLCYGKVPLISDASALRRVRRRICGLFRSAFAI